MSVSDFPLAGSLRRRTTVVFASIVIMGSLPSQSGQNVALVEKSKLYAAKGIVNGLLQEYRGLLPPAKRLVIIHSHAEYVSGWLVWAIDTGNGVLAGAFLPGKVAEQRWKGITIRQDDPKFQIVDDVFIRVGEWLEGEQKEIEEKKGVISLEVHIHFGGTAHHRAVAAANERGPHLLKSEAERLMAVFADEP